MVEAVMLFMLEVLVLFNTDFLKTFTWEALTQSALFILKILILQKLDALTSAWN
jgi:hypothetical protein